MGTGWAVGAAATLGLSVALLVSGASSEATGPQPAVLVLLLPFAFGAWAYGVSMASHGSKGALVALAGHAVLSGALLGASHLAPCLQGAGCEPQGTLLGGLALVVGVLTAFATMGEVRRRRGPIQWGTAAFLLAPLALALLVHVAASLA